MRKFLSLLGVVLALGLNANAQTGKITGKVTDSKDGSPLAGATIKVKGGGSTKTDAQGTFTLNAPSAEVADIEVSSIGYLNKSAKAMPGTLITVSLEVDPKAMNEIVVTGTGVATSRKKLGISVESVTADKLPQIPTNNIDQALIGKIAGAQISSVSGNPGDPVNIVLRGINTVQNGTKPLILLDGVEIRSDINSLDLTNIERVEVVQGAASATLYGAQGANGVIQLFSKRGKRGQMSINFSTSYATSRFINVGNVHKSKLHPYLTNSAGDLVDGTGEQLKINDQGFLTGISYKYGGATRYGILDPRNTNSQPYTSNLPYFDHFGQVFQTGSSLNNAISISGGGDKTDYSLAVSNNHTVTPVMKNGYYDRTNITANIGVELFKGFKIRSTTQMIYSKNTMHTGLGGGGGYYFGKGQSLGSNGGVYSFLNTSPFFDLTAPQADGLPPAYQRAVFLSVNAFNPYYTKYYNSSIDNKVDLLQTFAASYRVNKIFDLEAKYGVNYRNQNARWIYRNQSENENSNYWESWSSFFNTADNTGEITNWQYNNTFQNFLASAFAHVDFERDLHIKLPILSSTQVSFDYRNNKYREYDTYGLSLPLNPPFNMQSTASQAVALDYLEPFVTYGYLVNQKFDFGDFAGITAGFRSDWSSAFGGGSKPFTFPHFDGYILPSQMGFWKGNMENIMPYFKIRAAYGEAGIQPGAFDRYPVLNQGNLGNSLTYSQQSTIKNPNLQVEVSKETEVGTDLTFNINPKGTIFKTLNLSATYWMRSSANVIYSVALPPTTGATGQLTNAIDMSSKGFQFNLSVPIIQSKNWTWDFNTLFGRSTSMIDKIAGGASIPLTSAAGSTQILLVQGKRIGQIYAYKTFRSLDQTRQDGTPYIDKADRGKYAIVNGTVIDTATKGIMFTDETYPIGDGNPRFNMSFINSITYKGFVTLGWQFDWVSGQHLYNQTKEWMYRDGISGDFDKAVYFPNTGETSARTAYWASAYYGLWGSTRGVGNNATKDFFYEDASFVRLRNISLSFNFTRMLNIKAVKSLQLVLSGRNIATFTKYTGFDPEINSGSVNSSFDRGIDHSTLPNTKAYQVGINVGF